MSTRVRHLASKALHAILISASFAAPAAAQHLHSSGLPHNIPDFCVGPTVSSVTSGAWSNPATWSPARVPTAGDRVHVPAGVSVTYDALSSAALDCLSVSGQLRFVTNASTRLTAGTVMVMSGGLLEIGTVADPVDANVTAELVFADRALDLTLDPEQFGTGLIGLGTIRMHGAVKSPTFTRVTAEPLAGATTLATESSISGWRTGDRLILPDTRHLRASEIANWSPQWEELSLNTASGQSLALSAALQFNHYGARDGDNTLEFLPHVGNLTRNVVLRSANPQGTRGHVIFVARADVDVRYTAFRDLGRTRIDELDSTTFDAAGNVTHLGTNQIGRYPLHLHHLMGPETAPASGYQYTLIGNAIEGAPKWGLAIHDTHYGLVRENVLYNIDGAHLMTEDGSESYNVIEKNFAVRGNGTGGRQGAGREGVGFYFRGPNNFVRDNVAANLRSDNVDSAFGFKYYAYYLGNVNIPNFRGADTTAAGQYATVNANGMRILEFARNEVYGVENGMTYWWIGAEDVYPVATAQPSVIKDLRVWHVHGRGVFHYPSNLITIDGLVIRGKDPATAACCGYGIVIGDYMARQFTVRNADIQGMIIGFEVGSYSDTPSVWSANQAFTVQLIENSKFRNVTDIYVPTLYTSAFTSGGIPPRQVVIRNTRFDTPASQRRAIATYYNPDPVRNLTQRDEIFVFDYNQITGDNFRVYYEQQRPDFVVPQTIWYDETYATLVASPVAGLTNQQNWNVYGKAIAGGVAPCVSTRAGILGLVCPMTGTPGTLANRVGSAPAEQRSRLAPIPTIYEMPPD